MLCNGLSYFLIEIPVCEILYQASVTCIACTVFSQCKFKDVLHCPVDYVSFCCVLFVLQLHLAALASLKGDIVELNKRLQQTERERDLLEKKLAKAQVSDYSGS